MRMPSAVCVGMVGLPRAVAPVIPRLAVHWHGHSRHVAAASSWQVQICRPVISKTLGIRTAPSRRAASASGEREPVVEEEEEEFDPAAPHESLRVLEETKSKDLDSLLNQIDRGSINLDPRYQRQYIWSKEKACRLVESVMAKLFIPPVVLHTNQDGVHDVVDGKQRLTTLYCFRKGTYPDNTEFRLQGLTLLPDLIGMTYQKLPGRSAFPSQRHFDDYSLTVTTFLESTTEEAVLRVYEDLNCGAEILNKQQIRRAVYSGPYIDRLESLSKNNKFKRLLGAKGVDTSEKDRELILRFFSLWPQVVHGMDKYMTQDLAQHRQLGGDSSDLAKRMRDVFEATVDSVMDVYGDTAFRRWNGKSYTDKISLGLFDSVMLTMAHMTKEDVKKARVPGACKALRKDLQQLCMDPEFRNLLASFSAQRLQKRYDKFQSRVRGVLDKYARTFPSPTELKQQLYDTQDHKCALCKSVIRTLDDAVPDHSVPYSKGGSSEASNAQLVHTRCNSFKGSKSNEGFREMLSAPSNS